MPGRTLCIRIDENLYREILAAAGATGSNLSELVRAALAFYLENVANGRIAERLAKLERDVAELKRMVKKIMEEKKRRIF